MVAAALRYGRLLILALALAQPFSASPLAAQVPSPESYFGFRMGSDRQLAGAAAIEQYFELIAHQSDRVKIVDIGRTTEGHRTFAALISAPENIRNLDIIRAANQRLADPRTLSPAEARAAITTQKAVLAIGCSIHASEIGASQAANELLYSLATAGDPGTRRILQDVVVVLIPMLNPDGHRTAVDWFLKTKDTIYEGAPMPWLYHKYAGHDINRDAFMMNMVESRNLARFFYREWHPHVFLSLHQMGSNGPRMFVPPVADPIDTNYDPLIWREAALLGGAMALELQSDGRAGVISNAMYDYYWPGYEDSAPLGHNVVCLLAEVANPDPTSQAKLTTSAARSSVTETPQINYPDPWRGGSWTPRDVIDYHLSAVRGLLRAVAAYREPIVQNFYDMGRHAVEQGQTGGPFAFVLVPEQHDPHATAKLEQLLLEGSVEIHRALEPFSADGETYPAGSDVILLTQPYRAYAKTLLERQDYPAHWVSASTQRERPYDVAGWTLPAQMGVDVRTIEGPFEAPAMSRILEAAIPPAKVGGDGTPAFYILDARGNAGAIAINRLTAAGAKLSWASSALEVNGYRYAPGALILANGRPVRPVIERIARELGLHADGVKRTPAVATKPIATPRLALYKPWVENVDEGWTRWLLEQYEFRFKTITDADVRAGNLRGTFDAIVLPAASAEQLLSGHPTGVVPPEYSGGLGEPGASALQAFVEAGGTLICLDGAGGLAIDRFTLPVRDVAHDASADEFFCPGSIVRIELDPLNPVSYGMKPQTAGFFSSSSAYEIIAPPPTQTRDVAAREVHVIARYGETDLLLSGWLEGEQVIAGRPAALEITRGAGRIVLLGFGTQYRAQSHATFRLLFNAIFTATMPSAASPAPPSRRPSPSR